jgi:hypothetical protein
MEITMTNFEALKSNRKSQFDKLNSEIAKINSPTSNNEDNRFWKPDIDKAGNGYAIIRFLPAPSGEDVPFTRIWDHGFQGPGGWYIEKSLTTFGPGTADPCTEYNSQLWNSGIESNKEVVRKQKRRLSYYSNIYVVSDPNRPQNEGKVFLYKYGKKIFEKLNEAMHPAFDDQGRSPDHPQYDPSNAFNPFDLWEGANLKIKIRKVDGYPNYDKSEFDRTGPLVRDDDELEKIWKSEYSLTELLDPKNFKTYDELKKRLEKALGLAVDNKKTMVSDSTDFAPSPKMAAMKEAPKASNPWDSAEEDDEDLSFFKKLAKD